MLLIIFIYIKLLGDKKIRGLLIIRLTLEITRHLVFISPFLLWAGRGLQETRLRGCSQGLRSPSVVRRRGALTWPLEQDRNFPCHRIVAGANCISAHLILDFTHSPAPLERERERGWSLLLL